MMDFLLEARQRSTLLLSSKTGPIGDRHFSARRKDNVTNMTKKHIDNLDTGKIKTGCMIFPYADIRPHHLARAIACARAHTRKSKVRVRLIALARRYPRAFAADFNFRCGSL